jgi:hypothetical protein
MRIAYWGAVLFTATVCGAFAISNRIPVSLTLWPLPFAVALPLYLLIFVTVLIGFVAGVITLWFAGRHRRRTLRRSRRRIGLLESELAATRTPGVAAEDHLPPARD